jgi:hypothetical protein
MNTFWATPERVTITGYDGSAEDPWITSDGQYLLFDTHSDVTGASGPGQTLYCQMIDYKTCNYVGAVGGLSGDTSGTAAMTTDDAGNAYYLTSRYASQGITIAHGTFTAGTVTNIVPTIGINTSVGNMSASPSRDGSMLIFSLSPPSTSTIAMASKNADGSFTPLSNSATLLATANNRTPQVVYGPSLDPTMLELYFVAPFAPGAIYSAQRSTTTAPFGPAVEVPTQTTTLVEGPCVSKDGHRLYYHQTTTLGVGEIFVMSR